MGRGTVVPTPARLALLKRGLSGVEVARKLDLSYGSLANVLNGRTSPAAAPLVAEALSEYLGVEPEVLFPQDGAS
jgi:transcriptional regulator with XRE-family HTH domain